MGTVKDIKSIKSKNNELYTFVTINNLNVLDGKYEKKHITLRLQGGFIEGEGEYIHGSPRFNIGETVIVFMEGNGKNIVPIVGWGQGLFVIKRDEKGNSIIKDSQNNSIYSISDGYIDKEVRNKPDVRIISKSQSRVYSNSYKSSDGINDTQNILIEKNTIKKEKKVMSENIFIAKIRNIIRINKKKQKTINTVSLLKMSKGTADVADAKNPQKNVQLTPDTQEIDMIKLPQKPKLIPTNKSTQR